MTRCDCEKCDGSCRKQQIAVIQAEAARISSVAHSLRQNKNNILYNVRIHTSTNAVVRSR